MLKRKKQTTSEEKKKKRKNVQQLDKTLCYSAFASRNARLVQTVGCRPPLFPMGEGCRGEGEGGGGIGGGGRRTGWRQFHGAVRFSVE